MSFDDKSNGFSRKEFLKRISLGMGATLVFPGISTGNPFLDNHLYYYQKWQKREALPEDEKLGIALVGLGSYAMGQLAPALQQTKFCKLTGLVTGTPSKEKKYGEKYNIPASNIYNYETYDQIADNDDIDIIYVVLPNSMHAEYTIRAAEAGKHVICEKPMATTVPDAEAMVRACRDAGKKLSVGYRLHFTPHHQEVMRIGQEELYGPVSEINGGFSFTLTDPNRWRIDKEMAGGGPLMDVGLYAIQAALYTMGERPLSVTARTPKKTRPDFFSEVEETIYWTFEFPGGIKAHGESSYASNVNYHQVDTEEGFCRLEPAYGYGGLKGETHKGPMNLQNVPQQALQMDAFADCVLNDRESRVPGEMGLRDVRLLMAIYESAETGQKITFDW
ncbi:Gfo/Idh/MocA family protein [Halalkalibaculum sp. DA3122]|uniref:Gfo/Idh/MocA family protein n=1 Tax=Halalkalibaculum sp. DA3122 TaxID=3373607 RepID=UPI0037545CAC